jgi:hypothetical protein
MRNYRAWVRVLDDYQATPRRGAIHKKTLTYHLPAERQLAANVLLTGLNSC